MNNSKGYVMVLTLYVVLILTIYLLMILNASQGTRKQIIRQNQGVCAYYAAESGIVKALAMLRGKSPGQALVNAHSEEFERGVFTFSTEVSGGYFSITCKGTYRTSTRTLRSYLGQVPSAMQQTAITLLDTTSDLVAAGKTCISGTVALGAGAKVLRSTMPGLMFSGDSAVRGEIIGCDMRSAAVRDMWLQEQIAQQRSQFSVMDQYDTVITHSLVYDGQNRFPQESFRGKKVYVEGMVHIGGQNAVSGPIRFAVEDKLIITGNAVIDNADFIVLGQIKVSGNAIVRFGSLTSFGSADIGNSARVQTILVCNDSVMVHNSARALFPTLIYALGKERNREAVGGVYLSENAQVNATVVSAKPFSSLAGAPLSIASSVTCRGMFFSESRMDISGCYIRGHITAAWFNHVRRPRSYKNWLVNTTVDRHAVAKDVPVPAFFSDTLSLAPLYTQEL